MGKTAALRDGQGLARITLATVKDDEGASQLMVTVASASYEARGGGSLEGRDDAASAIDALLEHPDETGSFSVWDETRDNVESETPLLTCALAGDGHGHFSLALSFIDGDLRISDRFLTDEAAVRGFATALRAL